MAKLKVVTERIFFVNLLLRPHVAKTGRPRKSEGEKGTTQLRVFDEMAQKVSDLLLVLPQTTAQIMQRVAQANLDELYETHLPKIQQVKEARRAAEEVQARAREEAAKQDQMPTKGRKPK